MNYRILSGIKRKQGFHEEGCSVAVLSDSMRSCNRCLEESAGVWRETVRSLREEHRKASLHGTLVWHAEFQKHNRTRTQVRHLEHRIEGSACFQGHGSSRLILRTLRLSVSLNFVPLAPHLLYPNPGAET